MTYFQAYTIIDTKAALERLDNDYSLYSELIDSFLNSEKINFAQLKEYLEKNNIKEVLFVIHRLKGVSASLGAHELYKSCCLIEQYIRGFSGGSLSGNIGAIEIMYEEALEAFYVIKEKIPVSV